MEHEHPGEAAEGQGRGDGAHDVPGDPTGLVEVRSHGREDEVAGALMSSLSDTLTAMVMTTAATAWIAKGVDDEDVDAAPSVTFVVVTTRSSVRGRQAAARARPGEGEAGSVARLQRWAASRSVRERHTHHRSDTRMTLT
jgi:hypothetical protein